MGVSHLGKWAKAAEGPAHGFTGKSVQSTQVRLDSEANRPAETLGGRGNSVPMVPKVGSFEKHQLKPGNVTTQPPKHNANGGRAGLKTSVSKLGDEHGNERRMSGGRLG